MKDLQTASVADLNFIVPLRCKIKENNSSLHGAVINFAMDFDNAHFKVKFSNSSFSKKTNFSHCFLYFERPILAKKNDLITGTFALKVTDKNREKAQIKMSYGVGNSKKRVQYFRVE